MHTESDRPIQAKADCDCEGRVEPIAGLQSDRPIQAKADCDPGAMMVEDTLPDSLTDPFRRKPIVTE